MLLLTPPHPLITRLVLSSMWVCVCVLSPIQLFVTPWTVASILCPWNFPGKNTRVGCHFLLQGIFIYTHLKKRDYWMGQTMFIIV